MNRIPLKVIVGIALACVLFIEVHAESTGLNRIFDGKSLKSAENSIEVIKSELSETEFQVFFRAYGAIALKWAEKNGDSSEEDPNWLGLMRHLDGMRVSEIINLAASQDVSFSKNLDAASKSDGSPSMDGVEETSGPHSVKLNRSFIVDGIELLVSEFRIAKLEARKMRHGTPILPTDEYLLATVSMKNITEGKIVVIQNAWQQITLEDNFENLYEQPVELPYFLEYVEGVVHSQELRSGERTSDLIILPIPVNNARGFTLTSDPGFYKRARGGRLEPLSDTSFQIEFTRDDIQ